MLSAGYTLGTALPLGAISADPSPGTEAKSRKTILLPNSAEHPPEEAV